MDFCGNAVKLLMQAAHRRFGTLQHRRIFPRSQRGITSVLKRRIILLIEPFMEHGEDWSMEKIARSQWEEANLHQRRPARAMKPRRTCNDS
jgi:hypothetical protein